MHGFEDSNIYFDNAATTPLIPQQGNSLNPSCISARNSNNVIRQFANPSSPHILGLQAERTLGNARDGFAGLLNCKSNEITFTSGGTEANNIAIIGSALAHRRQGISVFADPWLHPSVLEPMRFVGEQDYLNIDKPAVKFFCLPFVNSETGDICNTSAEAEKIREANKNCKVIIFVDGVQGFCKEVPDLSGVDIFSFSAHKCHGASGVGGLFIRNGTKIQPLMFGGGQERGLRPGSENIEGIVSFLNIAENLHSNIKANKAFVHDIYTIVESIKNDLPDVFVNNLGENFSPYILNMSFLGVKGETLVHLLSERGLHSSMGAACRSRKNVKTALEHMGFAPERVASAVRFSFSVLNTIKEAETARDIIVDSVKQLRRMLRM